MKFICNQQTLIKALNTVSKAVSTKTTIPVLNGILIDVDEEGNMTIAASDNDISIKKIIKVEDYIPGSTVVTAKLFIDIIRKLPNEDITVEDDYNSTTIKTANSEFSIVSMNAEEFPKISFEDNEECKINIDKNIFRKMISMTTFAASNDESRGVLVGNLIELKDNEMTVVALDGFRMAVVREEYSFDNDKKIIITARILNEVNKILAESEYDEDITLDISNKRATVLIGNTVINIRLIEGEFINYKNIIPDNNKTEVIIERAAFLDSIERASILARGKNNLIKFTIKNNLLTMTSKSEEGNVKEDVIVEKTGEDIEIGFNSKYMIEALKVIEDEKVKLLLNSGVEPALIKSCEGNEFEYLILPVRITSQS